MYICLPDPNDVYVWYYIMWGIENPIEFKGGYYLGKIDCPLEYPLKSPKICLLTENGKFSLSPNGICLQFLENAEWNPSLKVSHQVEALRQLWISNEHGAYDTFDEHSKYYQGYNLSKSEVNMHLAMDSATNVLNHPKY